MEEKEGRKERKNDWMNEQLYDDDEFLKTARCIRIINLPHWEGRE